MFSRRSFLISLVMQPIVIGSMLSEIQRNIQIDIQPDINSEFVVINGWVLLKSDLLKIGS
mgnify:FL=1